MAQVHTGILTTHILDVLPSWTTLLAVQGRLGRSQANPLKNSKGSETKVQSKDQAQTDRCVYFPGRRRRLYKEIADRRNRKCMKKQQHLSIPGNNFSCFIYCPIGFPFTTACYHAKQQAALKKTSCTQLWTSCRLSSVHHHCPLLGWRSALTPPTKSATGPHSHLSAH